MKEITLYNTMSRKKEKFVPIKKGKVGMYSCGPTVYSYAHIGNLRAYVFVDTLRRTLEYNGYDVKHVMNITDVGHLTSDADTGEDKLELAKKRERKTAWEVARFYEKAFFEDIAQLNIQMPHIRPRATEEIKEQIEMVQKIEKNGYTYQTEDGIYFDTSKLEDYGKLARLRKENLKAGARIAMTEGKKNKTDFALWKFSPKDEKRDMEWNSPWGIGFPGWHIECSVMSMKYLGKTFDIHTGGVDHIPVHHTNEIAQSVAANGAEPVHYWMHNEHLIMKEGKMSKSKGEILILKTLTDKGYTPMEYRYFLLTSKYRKQLLFSWEGLDTAKNTYERLRNIIAEIRTDKPKINKKYLEKFVKMINDDLDTPRALAVMWTMLRDEKATTNEKYGTLLEMDKVFGLKLDELREETKIPKEIMVLVKEREKARKEKNWKLSDELREKIKKEGYEIDDTREGTKVRTS